MKLATVDVENGDNMATLPAAAKGGHPPPASAVAGGSNSDMNTIEKNNATNKEMELKNVTAKPLQRSICILFTLHTDRTGIEMGVDGTPNLNIIHELKKLDLYLSAGFKFFVFFFCFFFCFPVMTLLGI